MQIDEVRNRVEGNREPGEHVKYIFDEVIPKMCREDVKVDVIGMGDGAPEVVGYLRRNWEKWEGKVQAVALGTGFMWAKGEVGGEEKFRAFWGDVSPPLLLCHHSAMFFTADRLVRSNSAPGLTFSLQSRWICH